MRFEINVTYPQVCCVHAVCQPFLALLHHPQDDGNEAWVIIPGANFTNDVLANCSATDSDGDIAAFINIVWPEEFTLTLNFVAVSDVYHHIVYFITSVFRMLDNLGILVVQLLRTALQETSVILKTHRKIVSCKCDVCVYL